MYYDIVDRKVFSTQIKTLANLAKTVVLATEPLKNLPSIRTESVSLSSDNERYIQINIEHCFSADYKMDLNALGMYEASSSWPCIYCTQHKDQLHLKGN